MNIFDYNGEEFDKKLDEIFKNKDKEELKQELIECGLKIDVLNAFLLAGTPEIITQEEFDEVKQAIKNLIELNKKYESGEVFSNKQIKIVEEGIRIGAETAINKEMENFISKRKLENYLKEAQEKYEVYKRESKDNENLKPQMWIHKGEVNVLEIILDKPRKLVTLD